VAPALQTTQLLQRMDRAEIRIGLQSTDFGAIRLHTAVANDQVGAAVSTSHPALRDALLSEAPSLEKAMARHSLRLDSVSVDAGSANSDFNSFGSNERQPSQERLVSPAAWPAARLQQSQSAATAAPAGLEGSSRLDVRA
jgi:flagellar hook-length control protein FliK